MMGRLDAPSGQPRQINTALQRGHGRVGEGSLIGQRGLLGGVFDRQGDVDAAGLRGGARAVGPVGDGAEDDELPDLEGTRLVAPTQQRGGRACFLLFLRGAVGVEGVPAQACWGCQKGKRKHDFSRDENGHTNCR